MSDNPLPKHRIEIFSAGCSLCQKVIDRVHQLADSSFEVEVLDMQQRRAVAQAEQYGISRVPAVAINGQLIYGEDDAEPMSRLQSEVEARQQE